MPDTRKRPEDATELEILQDLQYWEDPDSLLFLGQREGGTGFLIIEQDWRRTGEGDSFKGALIDFGYNVYDPEYDDLNDEPGTFKKLNWTSR